MTSLSRKLVLLAVLAAAPSAAFAQNTPIRAPRRASAAAVRRAVQTITEADFSARLGALAHDSARGRETPSPELAKAADWIALQFRAAGLRPAGGDYLQRFTLRHTRFDSLSTLTFSGSGATTRWVLGRDIAVLGGGAPADSRDLPVVLMAGAPVDSARPFADVSVRGAVILLALPVDQNINNVINSVWGHAGTAGASALVVLADFPADRWARLLRRGVPQRWMLAADAGAADGGTGLWIALLSPAADLLRAAGEDVATVLTPERGGIRALGGISSAITVHETTDEEPTVANVVGVLEGSDPTLRNEAVIFTAHYDHVGVVGGRCQPSGALPADSICNGADDNASGTVGIIELARAFATLRPRPARTMIFAALAAEERGLFGARHYVTQPVVPIERTVADINLDMIARNPRDTVGFSRKDISSLGAVVDRMLREHPDLRLTPKEWEGSYPYSDHYIFAQHGVPGLFFFSGVYLDLHTAADNLDRADAAQAVRVAQLAFYVGLDVANTVGRPSWDPEARARALGN